MKHGPRYAIEKQTSDLQKKRKKAQTCMAETSDSFLKSFLSLKFLFIYKVIKSQISFTNYDLDCQM